MAERDQFEDLVRRLAAAVRSASLYTPDHPLVRRGIDTLVALAATALQRDESIVIGFIGDEAVVNGQRLLRSASMLIGFVRDLRERSIEKITITRGVQRDELRWFVVELADRRAPLPLPARLEQRGVRHVTIGRISGRERGGGRHRHRRRAQGVWIRRSTPRRRCGGRSRPETSRIPTPRARSSTAWPGSWGRIARR